MKNTKVIISLIIVLLTFPAINSYAGEEEYKDYTNIGKIEEPVVNIEDVFSEKDRYHREIITIEGTISEIEYQKLITGRKFTLFIVEDKKGNKINVYARGIVKGLSDGSDIRVHGRYSKNKEFAFKKYNNVMKAREIQLEGL